MPSPARVNINVNDKGSQTTVGLPGIGLSYRRRRAPWRSGAKLAGRASSVMALRVVLVLVLLAVGAIVLMAGAK